jgi:hypothetical protein
MSCTTTNFIQSKPSPFVYQARQREQKDIIRVKREKRETRDTYNLNMGREDTS